MAKCYICGEESPDYFNDERDEFCMRCKDILDYWFKEALTDIKTVVKSVKYTDYTAKEFAEALEVYGNVKWGEEIERSKNRKER